MSTTTRETDMTSLLRVDGSRGEGGGQILRSSLSLSLVTGKPFRIENIRARRKKPGLLRQHLTAVEAAARIGSARLVGARLGSTVLEFRPGAVVPGDYRFAVGTAGSSTLVLETVLPALLTASGPSTVVVEGGTHNPLAPPFDFLARALLPLLCRMGPRLVATLERPGFYPAGGGCCRVTVEPVERLRRIDILERGDVKEKRARVLMSGLPRNIGTRELRVVREKLAWPERSLSIEEVTNSPGPGNALLLELECEGITEVFTGFGQRGVSAELVARRAIRDVRRYLKSGAPIGEYLADQLLVPMALAGGGAFRTLAPSAHTRTNIEVLQSFCDVEVRTVEEKHDAWRVEIDPRSR